MNTLISRIDGRATRSWFVPSESEGVAARVQEIKAKARAELRSEVGEAPIQEVDLPDLGDGPRGYMKAYSK